MKLPKIERPGEITQVRIPIEEKVTKRVENFLLYYDATYNIPIDTKEFCLLAVKYILDNDKDFLKWEKENLTEKKTSKQPVTNGLDPNVVRT